MIKVKYIIVFLVLISFSSFSQFLFNNLDSLLTKQYNALNQRDSVYYLSLINQPAVFINAKTKADSLTILKPFTEAFNDVIDELAEMAMNPNFTVAYAGYEFRNKNESKGKEGRLPLHVKLIINDSFMIKMPVFINTHKELYAIESPLLVMIVDSKE